MFRCRSCLAECLRAVVGDISPASRRPHPKLRPSHRRAYATDLAPRVDYGFQREEIRERRRPRLPEDETSRRDALIAQGLRRSPGTPEDTKTDRHLALELRYLKDPLKLAGHIRHTLQNDELSKAVSLTRMASKTMQCTVSWNHIIDWLMARKSQKQAFKVYNEMKKRAQFPDSHTIILLLRGLAQPPVHHTEVGQALALYHSLAAPNSRVKQTIMHTNASLRVCALAGDMDSLWGVAGKIPEGGPGSADSITYTTIVNAIKANVIIGGVRDDPEAQDLLKEKAVEDAKNLWIDVTRKWRAGNLQIDEGLICAMGRLMLIGKDARDWDDVLSLVEQAMDIPRLAPKLGSEGNTGEHIRGISSQGPRDEEDPMAVLERQSRPSSGLFAKPGNNTLSLIMEACLKMAAQRVAYRYWDLLTGEYGIEPDLAAYHTYLRLLRQARASGRVVETLRPLVRPDVPLTMRPIKKTFRIAMSACVRDKNNPNVMDHASTLVDFMQQSLTDIDAPTLMLYLELAVSTQTARHMTTAFQFLAPHIQNLKSQVSFSKASDTVAQEVLDLFKAVIRTIDTLLNQSMVPRDEYSTWTKRKAQIAAFITRRVNSRSKQQSSRRQTEEPPHDGGVHEEQSVKIRSKSSPKPASRSGVHVADDVSGSHDGAPNIPVGSHQVNTGPRTRADSHAEARAPDLDEGEDDIGDAELKQLEQSPRAKVDLDTTGPVRPSLTREELRRRRDERDLVAKQQYRREVRQLRHFKRNSRKRESAAALADSTLDI